MSAGIARTMVAPSVHPAAEARQVETKGSGPFQDLIDAAPQARTDETTASAKSGLLRGKQKPEMPGEGRETGTDEQTATDRTSQPEPQGYAAHARTAGDSLPVLISLREIERASSTGGDPADATADLQPDDGAADSPLPERPDRKSADTLRIESETRPFRAVLTAERGTSGEAGGTSEPPASPVKDASASRIGASGDTSSPDKLPERVTVTSMQTFAAPAAASANPTVAALVDVLAGDEGVRLAPSLQSAAAFSAPRPAGPAHSLRIELHPAELGMVSARLHLAENQLLIEIRPDTHEGWRRLSSDSETITRAMRELGFEVGKVTILQPSATATPAGRIAETTGSERQALDFQSGQSGHDSSRGERHASGNNENKDENLRTPSSSARGGAGGGLYI